MPFFAPDNEIEQDATYFVAPDDQVDDTYVNTGEGPGESAFNMGMRSLAKVGTGTVEGLAQFADLGVRSVTPESWEPTLTMPFKAVAEGAANVQERIEERIPVNPAYAENIGTKAAGVAGQVAGQLGTLLTGAWISKAPKILQAIGLGQAGLLGLESGYEEADRLGITDPWTRDLTAASYAAAEAGVEGLGGFGSLGFSRALVGEIQEAMGKAAIKRALRTSLIEGIEEPITGTLQAGASNIFADQDPERPGYARNGARLPSIDPTTGKFWGARAEEALLGAFGGSLFAGAQFLGSRPRVEHARNVQQRAQAAIEAMAANPNPTAQDLEELRNLQGQEAELGQFIAEEERKIEAQPAEVQAIDQAAASAANANMPAAAAAIEQYKMATAAGLAATEEAPTAPKAAEDTQGGEIEEMIPAAEAPPSVEAATTPEELRTALLAQQAELANQRAQLEQTPRENWDLAAISFNRRLQAQEQATAKALQDLRDQQPALFEETPATSAEVLRRMDAIQDDETTAANLGISEVFHRSSSDSLQVDPTAARTTKQGKRGTFAGFYTAPNVEETAQYERTGGKYLYRMPVNANARVKIHRQVVDRFTPEQLEAFRQQGYDFVVGRDVLGRKAEIISLNPSGLERADAVAQRPSQAPSMGAGLQTPEVTITEKKPTESQQEEAWLGSPEFTQAEELAAAGDIEAAEALEASFREKQAMASTAAENAPERTETPKKETPAPTRPSTVAPPAVPEGLDPHWANLGRSQAYTEGDLRTELKETPESERNQIQQALQAPDNKPQTLAKALKALQPRTGSRGGSAYQTEVRKEGARRDAIDEQLDRDEGIVRARRRSMRSIRVLFSGVTKKAAETAKAALQNLLPTASEAWIGTSQEVKDAPGLRQAFIQTMRARDPGISLEEANDRFEQFADSLPGSLMEGFTVGGRQYVLIDGVGVTEEDGTPERAVRRVMIHEDTHEAVEAAIDSDPALKEEWEGIKRDITAEDLDSLAASRYPWMANWRNNVDVFNDLSHEWVSEQMEMLEKRGEPPQGLLKRIMDFFRKVLAKFMGEPEINITDQRVMDFIEAGRAARARAHRLANPVRPSQQNLFPEDFGVPAMPEGSVALITHQSPYPGMTSEKIAAYAWPRFYAAWNSHREDPDGPLTSQEKTQLETAWREELADENAMEIAADNAFIEERMSRMSMDVYDSGPFSTPAEESGRNLRFSMQPSYSSQSKERESDYKEAVAAMPESGREYVQFLGSLTRTPKVAQAVRPMVDFARSLMGSYQGDEIEVNAENTERVKDLAAQAFQKGKPGSQFAEDISEQFRQSGFSNNGQHQGSVMAGVLQMEILDYAVRLAGEGDRSLALALMPYANDVAAADHATLSNAGRALQMRSMAGQQKGFWTILNSLAKAERELAEENPIYKELRAALFSDEVKAETAAAVEKDMDSAEAQKAFTDDTNPEDVLDTYLGRALGIMDQAERDITIKLFTDMAELEVLLAKQEAMQAPADVKASMQAARGMNDPVAIQQRIDELKSSISKGLKALDKFKTSEASKETRKKALSKTPKAKKALSADADAKKMLDRLENKEKRTKKEPAPWKKAYTEQIQNPKPEAEFATELAAAGISPETATKLYEEAKKATRELQDAKDEAERRKADRKETQAAVSEAKERVREQKRDMERPGKIADQKSFINEVMRQIFSGTLEEQSDPNWRRMVMVNAFKKAGFSQGSAENAADYLGASLNRNLRQAQEKAAQKAAKDLKMKKPSLEKMVKAIRSRAIDPLNADPVTKALAAEAGFAGITPEQFTEMAKLDGQMRGPYQSQRAKASARMLDIALAARPPKRRVEILTQAWISSALSSLSTMSLSAIHAGFIPARRLATDFAGIAMDVTTGKTKPADAAQLMVNTLSNLQAAAKNMLATARFAGANDAYTQHIVEFINQMHSMQADLQRAVQTMKDPQATGIQKGKAAIKIAFTSTDIVRRILSTADETWGAMLQDFILRNEAMRVLVQKGNLSPTAAAMLFTAASNEGRIAAEKHLNETGNQVEAQLVARDATQNALLQAVRVAAGEQAAEDVGTTATLESPMELGNRRSEDAPLWDVVNTGLEWVKQLAIATRRKNELAGRMITGFVTVPANILNRSASFTPLGLARTLYKMKGDPAKTAKFYEETMKTEGQQRMRLIEGITGTLLIVALLALTGGDDDEGLTITGSGPEDKGLREAWMKKGNQPNRIEWKNSKGNVIWSIPYARGGFDHLNLPFTLVGTMDDMRLKGIKPKPANVEWGTQYMHTALKGLFDQAKFFGLKNVASMPTQNLTDKSLASQAAYLAAPVLPWSGLTKSLGRMWTGPTDQSSVRSAVLAQLPFTNFYATPALNALGDQRGPAPTDAQWEKALMSGNFFTVGAANKGPDADLYSMMIERGVAPNVPIRSNLERVNGLIEDAKWEQYLKTRGALIKQGIRKNLRKFKLLPHKDAQNLMERISADSTRAAKAKLRLE